MKDGSFYAFDVPILDGADIRKAALRERMRCLDELTATLGLLRPAVGSGGEFLEAVVARGGEGIVAKHLDSFFAERTGWVKCKRLESHDCLVAELHPTKSSARLTQHGQEVGWCKIPQGIAVGAVVEVRCLRITPAGKLREPRFVRVRDDK